jgi:hypothetical protein
MALSDGLVASKRDHTPICRHANHLVFMVTVV